MNTPRPESDDTILQAALRRDAARAQQEPPFDAALHHATMRRIRALADARSTRPGHFLRGLGDWITAAFGQGLRSSAIGVGLVAVTMVILGFWQIHSSHLWVGRANPAPPARTNDVPGAGDANYLHSIFAQAGGVSFDLRPFVKMAGMDSGLIADAGEQPGCGFDLEAPVGPMRLGCGCPASNDGSPGFSLGKFYPAVSDPF